MDDLAPRESVRPFRAILKIRNNRLIRAREQLGYKTAAAFCRGCNLKYQEYNKIEGMHSMVNTRFPYSHRGELTKMATALCELHGYGPDYFWPEEVRQASRNLLVSEVGAENLGLLPGLLEVQEIVSPEEATADWELAQDLRAAVNELSPRLKLILQMRFGMGEFDREWTLTEVADSFGLSRERVRQLEANAQRKLREMGLLRMSYEGTTTVDSHIID